MLFSSEIGIGVLALPWSLGHDLGNRGLAVSWDPALGSLKPMMVQWWV